MGVNQYTTSSGGTKIEDIVFTDGVIDFNGKADCIILDADGDTTICASTDDQIDIEIAGADDFTFTANSFNVLSGSAIVGPSSTFGTFSPIAAQQDLSGAGAINITTAYTAWTTSSTDAGTLIDGVIKGQLKKIQLVSDGGDGTLTPSNLTGGSTITFADVGDYCVLCWNDSSWVVLELNNAADGTTAPVLA